MNDIKVYFSDLFMKVYLHGNELWEAVAYCTLLKIFKPICFSDIMNMCDSNFLNKDMFGESIIDYLLLKVIHDEVMGTYTEKLNKVKNKSNVTMSTNFKDRVFCNSVAYIFKHNFMVSYENGDDRNDLRDSDTHATNQANGLISECHARHQIDEGNNNTGVNFFSDFGSNTYSGFGSDDCTNFAPGDCTNFAPGDCTNFAPDDCTNFGSDDCTGFASFNTNCHPSGYFNQHSGGSTKVTLQQSSLEITCTKSSLHRSLNLSFPLVVGNHSTISSGNNTFVIEVIVDSSDRYSLELCINENSRKIEVVCFLKDNQVVVEGRVDNGFFAQAVSSTLDSSNYCARFELYWIV